MFRNYIKTSVRNLFKNKTFSLINILGLALGMACSLLIWLWVQDERGIDSFHVNNACLYRVYERQYHDNQVDAGYGTPGPLPEGLKDAFPEIKYATGMAWRTVNTFEASGKILKESGDFGSADFFNVFSYPLLEGRAETALKTPIDIAISRKMAEDFFGTPQAAIGQALRLKNKKDLKVSAVFENVPNNSSQEFDYILNWRTFQDENTWSKEWGNQGPATYVVLQEGADAKSFESKIEKFLDGFSYNKNFLVRLALQKKQ